MRAHFDPGQPGKGHYSDTNYQVLGMVIEACDGRSYEGSLQARILDPLGLSKTFLYTHATHDRFGNLAGMVFGKEPIALPKALASFGPDGAMVATAQESVEFLKAMWTGELVPADVALAANQVKSRSLVYRLMAHLVQQVPVG